MMLKADPGSICILSMCVDLLYPV